MNKKQDLFNKRPLTQWVRWNILDCLIKRFLNNIPKHPKEHSDGDGELQLSLQKFYGSTIIHQVLKCTGFGVGFFSSFFPPPWELENQLEE